MSEAGHLRHFRDVRHESAFLPLASKSRASQLFGLGQIRPSGRAYSLCPGISDVHLFRYRQRIIHLDTEVSDSAFDLGVAEQELDGA